MRELLIFCRKIDPILTFLVCNLMGSFGIFFRCIGSVHIDWFLRMLVVCALGKEEVDFRD